MKPTIPETGRIIKLEGEMAVVLLHAAKSCKGCGAAAIGLCKPSGGISTVIARNTRHAGLGDTVTMTLDNRIRRKGFLLAYVIPLTSFVFGSLIGYVAKTLVPVPSLEVFTGFASLIVSGAFTLRKLCQLDKSSSLMIKDIVPPY